MIISNELVKILKSEYNVQFYDETKDISVHPDEATWLLFPWQTDPFWSNKWVKFGKSKMVTFDMIVDKIQKSEKIDNVYKSFTVKFKELLNRSGIRFGDVFATSYGIGVLLPYNNKSVEMKQQISNLLDFHGIKYSTDTSDAGWVFRYRISKTADNIKAMENV
jgi:hypothetical protein